MIQPILLLLAFCASAGAEEWSGKVVGVADGDTVTVLRETSAGKREVKIRLHAIDSPEKGQAFGAKAKQQTSELAFGKVVRVRVVDTDRYGRTVAVVTLPDGRILSQELVREGFAWHYVRFDPGNTTLAALEREARENRRGLWADKSPIPPWAWRGKKRK